MYLLLTFKRRSDDFLSSVAPSVSQKFDVISEKYANNENVLETIHSRMVSGKINDSFEYLVKPSFVNWINSETKFPCYIDVMVSDNVMFIVYRLDDHEFNFEFEETLNLS